jgi:Amt family ammonium transporter
MMQVTVAVIASVAEEIMMAIAEAARTEEPGNGKVFACDLSQVVDVSSGTTGPDAIHHREKRDG